MTAYLQSLGPALKAQKRFKLSEVTVLHGQGTNIQSQTAFDREFMFEITKGSMCLNATCGACYTAYDFAVEMTLSSQQELFIRIDKPDDCCVSGVLGGAIGVQMVDKKLTKMRTWIREYTIQFINMNSDNLVNTPTSVQLL